MYDYSLGSIIISLILTVIGYGVFPTIIAKTCEEPITAKKYNTKCWIINAVIMLFFAVVSGGTSGGPYVVWTLVFTATGRNILTKKAMLIEGAENDAPMEIIGDELANCETEADRISYFKKIYQDTPDKKLITILDNPDYLAVTKQAVQQILDERAEKTYSSNEEKRDIQQKEEIAEEINQVITIGENKAEISFCRKCGNKLPEGSKFCNRCGTQVWADGE